MKPGLGILHHPSTLNKTGVRMCARLRRPFLADKAYDWSLTVETFGDAFHYFVYRLHRGEAPEGERGDAAPAFVAAQSHERESMMHEHMDQEDYLLKIEL